MNICSRQRLLHINGSEVGGILWVDLYRILEAGDIVSLGEAKGHNEPVLIVGQVLYVGDDFPFFSVSTGDEEFICERWAYSNENNRDECHGDTFIVEESVGTISYCRIFEGND